MLERDDPVPDFALPTAGRGPVRFFGVAGGEPAVLAFLADAPAPAWPSGLRAFTVHRSPPPDAADDAFIDTTGALWRRCAGPHDAVAFVIAEDLRVIGVLDGPPATWPEAAAEAVASRPLVAQPAPVLLVPRAFDDAFCARLIDHWERAGHAETGVERSVEGGRADRLEAELKRRRDHTVTQPGLFAELTQRVTRRICPGVRRALQFDATRFEGFKIGCYTAEDAGRFRRHRDNLSPNTRHRRFALSVNLNDDYAGGALCFPEFGPATYRPERGGAIVFSASLLHEAQPVTAGRRFVLLSFLYGEGDRSKAGS